MIIVESLEMRKLSMLFVDGKGVAHFKKSCRGVAEDT